MSAPYPKFPKPLIEPGIKQGPITIPCPVFSDGHMRGFVDADRERQDKEQAKFTRAGQALLKALRTDRIDVEDWPEDSRKALDKLTTLLEGRR